MPEITVAITTHNLEKYLPDCFRELMAQSFQDFEILVFDDCSTDHTWEILQEYQNKLGEKLQLLPRQERQGLPGKSRNVILGSGKIQGKYLIFLDGDDSIEPDFLEKLYQTAERTKADVTICAYDRVEADSGHVLCREMQGYPKELHIGREESSGLAWINTSLWNKLILAERVREERMPAFSVGEDACFLLAIYRNSTKLAFVNQTLIHYRVRTDSVIANTSEETIYAFSRELSRMYHDEKAQWMRDNLAFAAFIHIGLSMCIRVADKPQRERRSVLRWVRNSFSNDFMWFRGNPYVRFACLARHGSKGVAVWLALLCHKLGIFALLLWGYGLLTRVLRIDIKF